MLQQKQIEKLVLFTSKRLIILSGLEANRALQRATDALRADELAADMAAKALQVYFP